MKSIGPLFLALLLAACPSERPDEGSADDDDSAGDDDSGDDDDSAGDDDSGDDDDATSDDDAAAPTVSWAAPQEGTIVQHGGILALQGTATDAAHAPTELSATFTSNVNGLLHEGAPDAGGAFAHTTSLLDPGWHQITLEACNPDARCASAQRTFGVCEWGQGTGFDPDLAHWTLYADAQWDPAGFIELTGNAQNRRGQAFNTVDRINPGDVAIRFFIQTGPNSGNGADGFAMTVVDASDPTDLELILASSANGGGLAYGYGGAYGTLVRDALHVEIDTWENIDNGDTELHTDPTAENHIAVTLDGDPGNHILWTPIPNIEDSQWHEVLLEVQGSQVTVTLDATVVLDGPISGWSFRGGYIGFSGSTGYYTNHHRIQDLELLPACVVP